MGNIEKTFKVHVEFMIFTSIACLSSNTNNNSTSTSSEREAETVSTIRYLIL